MNIAYFIPHASVNLSLFSNETRNHKKMLKKVSSPVNKTNQTHFSSKLKFERYSYKRAFPFNLFPSFDSNAREGVDRKKIIDTRIHFKLLQIEKYHQSEDWLIHLNLINPSV